MNDQDILTTANEFAADTLAQAERLLVTERPSAGDYALYWWQRAMCAFGRHRYYQGWVGGRVCLICLRADTADVWDDGME